MKTTIKILMIGLLLELMAMSSTIQAFDRVSCNSRSIQDCVFDISNSLGIENYEACELKSLNFEKGSVTKDGFYSLICPSDRFFLKELRNSNYQENTLVDNYLSTNCLSEFCSMLVKPVREVSLLSDSVPLYYSVFPYVEGKTLSTIKEKMYSNGLDRKKLNILYRKIGMTLGTLHSSGIINKYGESNFILLKSRLVHGDLHSSNIIVKSDSSVLFVDTDGLYKSVKSPQQIVIDINTVILQVLPGSVLLLDDPDLSDWISAFPEFITNFIDGYCSLFTETQYNECNSKVRKQMVSFLRTVYQSLLTKDDSESEDESEAVAYINAYVLESRLGKLLSSHIESKRKL
ncbi:hypothetical protein [Endozoicomonas sp. 8E]|uniref:hypothetical protein n=1 Tax=Endozoicomonas sp. 8E TaxID=3035692 RepID=UPI002938D836|nr:hypothetical protein [Endozoicomonas sp. 8E]WOG28124.1 hypothetical protein P6910_00290 [Endozoicomonas sp. 8E]